MAVWWGRVVHTTRHRTEGSTRSESDRRPFRAERPGREVTEYASETQEGATRRASPCAKSSRNSVTGPRQRTSP